MPVVRSGATQSANSSGATISTPATTQVDDLVIAVLSVSNLGGVTVTPPAGWTTILTQLVQSDSYLVGVYSWVATSAGATGFTWNNNQGYSHDIAQIVFDDATLDVSGTAVYTDNPPVAIPGVTTTRADDVILGFITKPGTHNFSNIPTFTERLDGSSVWLGTLPKPTAGATGDFTLNDIGAAAVVAFRDPNVAPNAPTITTMTGGSVIDLSATNRGDWDYSDPDAGDSQSKFDLRYKLVGAGTWTNVTQTTVNTFYDFAGGTFTAGDYEWQVRTYDALGVVGPYSASSFFTAASSPAPPSITDPINGATIATATGSITWSAPDQDSYQVRKVADNAGSADTGTVYYDTGEVVSSTARTASLTYPVNSRYEHLQVRVKNDGLWSTWASIRVQISYTEPATPTAVVTSNTPAGAVTVSATHPTPTGSQPTVTSMDIHRRVTSEGGDGIRIAAAKAPGASFVDWAVASAVAYEYRVKAIGDTGTTSFSAWTS